MLITDNCDENPSAAMRANAHYQPSPPTFSITKVGKKARLRVLYGLGKRGPYLMDLVVSMRMDRLKMKKFDFILNGCVKSIHCAVMNLLS